MRPWMVRASLGLYIVCMVGLLTGYMGVASMEVPAAGWVQGGEEVAPGPNVLRVRLDRVKDGRALLPAAPIKLTVGDTPVALSMSRGGVWPGSFTMPPGVDGPLPVRLDVALDEEERLAGAGEVSRRAEAGIRPLTSRRQQEIQPGTIGVSGESGEVKITFLPSHGELVRGIRQRVWGRTTDAYGAPLACELTVLKREGVVDGQEPASSWRTDAMGLGWIEISPVTDARLELAATCGELSGAATWYLTSVPAQLAMRLDSHAVKPGASVTGSLKNLARGGTLWVEVAQGGAWRWSGASQMGDGASALTALIPAELGEGLAQIQASQDMHDAGSAWEMRYVVIVPDGSPRSAASYAGRLMVERDPQRWRAWVGAMEARMPLAEDAEVERWLELLLSELPPTYVAPKVWLHTLHEDQQALDTWKHEVRGWLFGAIALGMLVGLIGLMLAVGHMASQRARSLRQFEADELDEQEHGELGRGGDVMSVRVQSALVIGTLVLFGLCILMLLRFL